MNDLTTFRDHAARMATAEHKPECRPRSQRPRHAGGREEPPRCPGCVTDSDRALWQRLADEVDAYLATDDDDGALFA